MSYVLAANAYRTKFDGIYRNDYKDYPEVASREALVNAIVHREYAVSGPVLISVMPSMIQADSLGGLPYGIEYSDLSHSVSVCRNPKLANIFYRLNIIEAYGTGISRMRDSYEDVKDGCHISVSENVFTVVLKNRNVEDAGDPLDGEDEVDAPNLSETEAKAFELLREKEMSRENLQYELGLSTSTTLRILSKLQRLSFVSRSGTTRGARYRAVR